MATNNRIPVKWVRDRCKSAYEKKSECYICGSVENLELHHLGSITLLLEKWVKEKGHDISTDAGILAVRDDFIREHNKEIYEDVVTLCNKDHIKLHALYGKAPLLNSVEKQAAWIETQKNKGRTVNSKIIRSGLFAKFC